MNVPDTVCNIVPVVAWLVLGAIYLGHLVVWRHKEYIVRVPNFHHFTHFVLVAQAVAGLSGLGRLELRDPAALLCGFLGLLSVSVGFLACSWGKLTLGRFWDMHASIQAEHALVRGGPYRWCRNPIFLGQFLLLVGTGLAWGNVLVLVLGALSYWSFDRRIAKEERCLEYHFGNAFAEYRSETVRFLARLPSRQTHGRVARNG